MRRPCLDHGSIPTRVMATDNSNLSPRVAPTYTCMRIGHITRTHNVGRTRIGTVMSGGVDGPFLKIFNARAIGILRLGVTLRRTSRGGWFFDYIYRIL